MRSARALCEPWLLTWITVLSSRQYTRGSIARTSELYIDRRSVRAAYALTDANGEPKVSRSGLLVRLVLSFSDGGAPLFDAGRGAGSAQTRRR